MPNFVKFLPSISSSYSVQECQSIVGNNKTLIIDVSIDPQNSGHFAPHNLPLSMWPPQPCNSLCLSAVNDVMKKDIVVIDMRCDPLGILALLRLFLLGVELGERLKRVST